MREKELKKRAERGENDVKGKKKRFEHWQIIAAYLVIYCELPEISTTQ